jgi:hypothetical protein
MEFDSDAVVVGGCHTELAERVAAAGSGQLDLVARRLDEIEDGVADSTVVRVEWDGPVALIHMGEQDRCLPIWRPSDTRDEPLGSNVTSANGFNGR